LWQVPFPQTLFDGLQDQHLFLDFLFAAVVQLDSLVGKWYISISSAIDILFSAIVQLESLTSSGTSASFTHLCSSI